jgi:hypothetical protein
LLFKFNLYRYTAEGTCDGAVGAAVGVLNALCTHSALHGGNSLCYAVIERHPRFDDVVASVVRAMSSQCSCAWATFSFIVNLAGKGGRAVQVESS